jgi:outer membrane protein insertion porin family
MGKGTVNQFYQCQLIKAGRYFTLRCCILWSCLFLILPPVVKGQVPLTVHFVEFEGNHTLSANQLTTILLTKRGDPFSESLLSNDLERILDLYKDHAYLHTRIDSMRVQRDTITRDVEVRIFLTEGKPSVVRHIEFDGSQNLIAGELYASMQLHEGDPFLPSLLEQDIQTLLQYYENKGFPLSKISVQNISFANSADEMSVTLHLQIDEGKAMCISELRIEGNKTTKDYVIMREARLRENELFRGDLPERIKRRLDHLQLFLSVPLPELYLIKDKQAGLLVRVEEGNQNNFDGVIGYVPSTVSGESGYMTGLVNLSLRNLFGTGRKLSVRWFQETKSSQETELHYFEPWIASYPVNAQLGFFQRKQDSTFVRIQYDIATELMITEEFSVGISFLQNNVYPSERYNGEKVIAESRTMSFGAFIKYDSRDNPVTPTNGIFYSTEYQTGTKQTLSSDAFPVGSKSTTRRVVFDLSYYLSPFLRQVLATELHLRDFSNDHADVSDLFRIGGATTLRGYREGFFLGSRLVWINLEYRFLVASRSYLYGFTDIGYIVQPGFAAADRKASEQSKIGYGIGVRMDSALGLIGVSIALGEGDTFSTSKIHIRLINEF